MLMPSGVKAVAMKSAMTSSSQRYVPPYRSWRGTEAQATMQTRPMPQKMTWRLKKWYFAP